MATNNQPGAGSSDPNARSNNTTWKGGGGKASTSNPDCDETILPTYNQSGDMHAYIGVRPTDATQYTTGQLEYARTCLKKTIEVEGYHINNEFEEEHNITVDEVTVGTTYSLFFNRADAFDAEQHSDVILKDPSCGEGLRFRLNVRKGPASKGVFEHLWEYDPGLRGDVTHGMYFYDLGLLDLICQEYVPYIDELADHECIKQYLTDFDYWYQLSEKIVVGDDVYPKNSYIKVMPNGEFDGPFEFENEEDVPIKECELFYEVKDIVKLDINGKWVEKRPEENSDSKAPQCIIEHGNNADDYTVTAITDEEPETYSYDYGKVDTQDISGPNRNPMPAFYYPEDHLAFIPVWDEVCYVEGKVEKTSGENENECPNGEELAKDKVSLLMEQANFRVEPQEVWDIQWANQTICSSIWDEQMTTATGDTCGYYRALMLNPHSDWGPGMAAEYFKTKNADIQSGAYTAEVEAPAPEDSDEPKKVKVPVVIDCFYGNDIKDGAIMDDGVTCLHCDCHKIVGERSPEFDINCDPCQRCGDGIGGEPEEGPDYYHIQNICPDELRVSDHCKTVKCDIPDENLTITNSLEVTEGDNLYVDFDYAYRKDEAVAWTHAYEDGGDNEVKYGETHTYRCIITYNGGCADGMDFMKETPEFLNRGSNFDVGESEITTKYRKIVSADEFNKCGTDRLPNLEYRHLDLIKVEGIKADDYFPQAAVATKIDLTPVDSDLDSYGLNVEEKTKVSELLEKMEDFNAVVHKTKTVSQESYCGMGSLFREERRKQAFSVSGGTADYGVHCRAKNYIPHLYADKKHGQGYGVIPDYQDILDDYDELIEGLGLSVEDGTKIWMWYLYGSGTICEEIMRRASRVPVYENGITKINDNFDSWKFFGRRFVNPSEEVIDDDLDGPNNDEECDGEVRFQLMSLAPIRWRILGDGQQNCMEDCKAIPPDDVTPQERQDFEDGDGIFVVIRRVPCTVFDAPPPPDDKTDEKSCYQKYEVKPVPTAHPAAGPRICPESLLTDYAYKLIGYTEKDALHQNALLDNLIEPIAPGSLLGKVDENKPSFKIVAHKSLCSLKKYSFSIGDSE